MTERTTRRAGRIAVVVVDDDEQEREGRRVVLERLPGVDVLAAVHPRQAMEFLPGRDDVDVVLLDLWERGSRAYDEFAGVAVATEVRRHHPVLLREAVRSGRWAEHVTIVAVSRMLVGEVIGKRLREVGVDLVFDRDDPQVCESAGLAEVVGRPQRFLHDPLAVADGWRPTAAAESLGIAAHSRVNDLLAEAEAGGPAAVFRDGGRPAGAAERRVLAKARDDVARRFGLVTPPSRRTGGTRRHHLRFDDLRTLLDRARRPDGARHPDRGSDTAE